MAAGESGFTPPVGADRPPTFNLVRRGFDPDQVVTYLRGVAQRVQALETKVHDLEKERDEARRERDIALEAWDQAKESRGDPYGAMSAHVADLVRAFDEEVERLRRDAQAEADRILTRAKSEAERTQLEVQGAEAEARTQAEHIVRQAREEADQIVAQARVEADRVQRDLLAMHGSTLNELRIIRDHMANSIKELEGVLNGDRVVVVGEADGEGAPAGGAVSATGPETPSELGG